MLFREVEDYMSDKVNYVVTSSAWDDNFDDVSYILSCYHECYVPIVLAKMHYSQLLLSQTLKFQSTLELQWLEH